MTTTSTNNQLRDMATNSCCPQIRDDEGGGSVRASDQQQSCANLNQPKISIAAAKNKKHQKNLGQYETRIMTKHKNNSAIDHFDDGDDEQDYDDGSDDNDDQYEQAMDIFVKHHFDDAKNNSPRSRERRTSLPTEDIELNTFSSVVMQRKRQLQTIYKEQQQPKINADINDQSLIEQDNHNQKDHHLMPVHKSSKNNRPLSISSISSAASSGSSASSNSSSSSGIHSSLTRNSSLNYSQEFKRNNYSYLESVESLDSSVGGSSCQHHESPSATESSSSPTTSATTSSNTTTNVIEQALKNLQLSNRDNSSAQTRAAILAAGELQRRSFNIHQATIKASGSRTCAESRFSRINRSFHASLRYDKSTAYRIHLMANARALGLVGQTKSYNLGNASATDSSNAISTKSTVEPRGIFRRYSSVSRNNSSTSSDSGHISISSTLMQSCRCGATRKMSAEETSCSSPSIRQSFNMKAATLDGSSCQRTLDSSNEPSSGLLSPDQHHPTCPVSLGAFHQHHQRPLRASPKLQQSPSSVSSYSNNSSLFRDDGFEDDLTSTTSEHSSSITSASTTNRSFSGNYIQLQQKSLHSNSAKINDNPSIAISQLHNHQQQQQQRLRIHQEQELSLLSISQRVVTEIIETQRSYVEDLEQIVSGYLCKLRDTLDLHSELFSNLEDVYKFNKDFLFQLEECYLNPGSIAACFVENASKFDVYTHYCTQYPQVLSTLTKLMAQPATAQLLKDRQSELNHSLPLGAYLLKPVQRILKYNILFKSLIKHITDDETVTEKDRESINEAFLVMTNIACHLNEMKKKHEHSIRVQELQSMLRGWEGPDLTTLGELILEDGFRLFQRQKSTRHLLLFDNVLLITKKKCDGSLHYKGHIECTNLMLIETIQGQPLVFNTVPFDNPKALCAFQADNLNKKRDWCIQMKEVIIKSFEVKIPVHVRGLLMSLTQTSTNAMQSDKTHNTRKCPSSEKNGSLLRAPEYLEKKRKTKQQQQVDKIISKISTAKH